MQRWIGKYQSVGERPLTEEEAAHLKKVARRPRYLVLPAWFVGFTGLPVAIMSMMILDDLGLSWLGLIVVIAVLGLMVFLPLSLRDARKLAKSAKIDLKTGIVELFEVPAKGVGEEIPPTFDEVDDDWDDDPDNPPYELEPPAPGTQIEVMKGTGMVLSFKGKPVKGHTTLVISSVANTPSVVPDAAFPERFDYNDDLDAPESERNLSADERKELQDLLKDGPGFPYFFTFMTFYVTCGLVAGIRNSSLLATVQVVCFGAILVSYVYGWIRFSEHWRGTRALRRDLKRGVVLRRDTSKMDLRSAWGMHKVIELLPRSNLVWTVDGAPADWRKYK